MNIKTELDTEKKKKGTNRRESIACIRNQQARFTNSTITDGDTLNEPWRTHFHRQSTRSPIFLVRMKGSKNEVLMETKNYFFPCTYSRRGHQESIPFNKNLTKRTKILLKLLENSWSPNPNLEAHVLGELELTEEKSNCNWRARWLLPT